MSDQAWRKCSSCKKPLEFNAPYWACSVSTCNSKRMGYFFCSVSCWEAHLPSMRHREAWAVEKRAPSRAQYQQGQARESAPEESTSSNSSVSTSSASTSAPKRRRAVPSPGERDSDNDLPKDVLIVVSKLKKYIKAKSGFKTSDGVTKILSDHVRALCDQAIRHAGEAERKTVLDRDFPPVR